MKIQWKKEAKITDEYGCAFRRMYPWQGYANTQWGSAWANIAPGTNTTEHGHDEEETFIIVSGEGEMTVDGETKEVSKGDVIYLPPFSHHTLKNTSSTEVLEMICIWWSGEQKQVKLGAVQ
ncbi:cupin domain-containing protein [Halotia wernerae UHCC 0503]|nr:cupin domain-containing protein [Halotia wernerae UHCC 0503]